MVKKTMKIKMNLKRQIKNRRIPRIILKMKAIILIKILSFSQPTAANLNLMVMYLSDEILQVDFQRKCFIEVFLRKKTTGLTPLCFFREKHFSSNFALQLQIQKDYGKLYTLSVYR